MAYTLSELAKYVNGEILGDPAQEVTHLAPIEKGELKALSVLSNPLYKKYLNGTKSSVVVLHPKFKESCTTNAILHNNPYYAFAKITQLFEDKSKSDVIRQLPNSAYIDDDAKVHPSAIIAPNVVIMSGVDIAEHVIIGPGCVVGYGSKICAHTELKSNVSISSKVKIGEHCIIQSGVVIGSDGFGFAETNGEWERVAQLGGVSIENNVHIGANTTIDRGALADTKICEGVILDNQIQIAHNVFIGKHTAIAGCVGIAGSTKIGAYCRIGGGTGIAGHLEIVDNTFITAWSMIIKSISKAGTYSSGIPAKDSQLWRKNIARLHNLDEIIVKLQTEIKSIKLKLENA